VILIAWFEKCKLEGCPERLEPALCGAMERSSLEEIWRYYHLVRDDEPCDLSPPICTDSAKQTYSQPGQDFTSMALELLHVYQASDSDLPIVASV